MSWHVSRREHEGKEQFRIWTTGSDCWITDWASKESTIKMYAERAMNAAKDQIVERFMSFPFHLPNHDSDCASYRGENQEGMTAYHEWATGTFKGNHREEVDKKYKEVMAVLDETEWPDEGPEVHHHIEVRNPEPEGWTRVKTEIGWSNGHRAYEELTDENPTAEYRMVEEEVRGS